VFPPRRRPHRRIIRDALSNLNKHIRHETNSTMGLRLSSLFERSAHPDRPLGPAGRLLRAPLGRPQLLAQPTDLVLGGDHLGPGSCFVGAGPCEAHRVNRVLVECHDLVVVRPAVGSPPCSLLLGSGSCSTPPSTS
jgi:hypothetical protein